MKTKFQKEFDNKTVKTWFLPAALTSTVFVQVVSGDLEISFHLVGKARLKNNNNKKNW